MKTLSGVILRGLIAQLNATSLRLLGMLRIKQTLLRAFVLLIPCLVFAQGQVNFSNTSTTLITTNVNGVSGPISPAGAFTIGFYAGPQGASEGSLTLLGNTLNSSLPGRVSGGNPYILPAGFPAGTTIAFQIRVWETAGGSSYEQAETGGVGYLIGKSALGFVIPTAPPSPVPSIFGMDPGQVGGIILAPIPEPSAFSLLVYGSLLALLCRKCRRTLMHE